MVKYSSRHWTVPGAGMCGGVGGNVGVWGTGPAATVTSTACGGWGKFSARSEGDVNPDLSLSFSGYQVDIWISVWLTPVTISQLALNFVGE